MQIRCKIVAKLLHNRFRLHTFVKNKIMKILKFLSIIALCFTVGAVVMLVSTKDVFEVSKTKSVDRKNREAFVLANMAGYGIATLALFAIEVYVWKYVFDLI